MSTIIPVLLGADLNCYNVARAFHQQYGVISFGDATMDLHIQREPYGFYSSGTASNETWLNDYELNPLKANEFYFIYEAHDDRTLDASTIHIGNHNGIPGTAFSMFNYSSNVYKIVVNPVFLQDAWQYGGGFQIWVRFNEQIADGRTEDCESSLQLKLMDLGSADAAFEINDQEYLYFAEENGWILHGDPANDWRPGVGILPAGVSYDYERNKLTLNNAKLNNLSLQYLVYDENGQPTAEERLPNGQLTLELIGNSVIETGHRAALSIGGNLNVTVTGTGKLEAHSHNDENNYNEDGQRYAFDTINVENNSTLTIASGTVITEISGNGYWDNANRAMPAAIRGRNGSNLVISGGELCTMVPQNARDNAPDEQILGYMTAPWKKVIPEFRGFFNESFEQFKAAKEKFYY